MALSQDLMSRVRHHSIESHCLRAGFLGDLPVFAGTDGMITFCDESPKRISIHPDGLLVAQFTRDALISGGEDGRILRTTINGTKLVADAKGQWIDALATGPDGAIAWAVGKTVSVQDGKGRIKVMSAPTTPQGLSFLPKGYRLAIPHYNGASLWFPNTDAEPEAYVWKGSHLDVTVSPDGRYLVTSMQENALHGWRITDKAHMRMTGYPAKTRSMSWSHDGNWLATSGAEAAIIWPFSGKDGPMGKAPRECGVRPKRVSQVAFHPSALVLAIGYDDGFVMLVRLTDASELAVRAPKPSEKTGAVSALAWDKAGRSLAIGGTDGYAGLLTLP